MIFVIFLAFSRALKKSKLKLTKYICCEMPENVPKALDQTISNLLTWSIAQRRSPSRARLVIKEIGCKKIVKIFSPMATNRHTISLICENRTFFIVLLEKFFVHLNNFFQPFSGNRSHEILLKSNLPMLSVFIKYFNLSTIKQELNHSKPRSTTLLAL